ncbi:LOB domain-containing protein 29-like [Andrographis paniculata]|uniref:LOB domain-containing protein 29-like n=1 Tax=Andrographis paniculata TaxID=175694 RepID=UPI0021E93A5F|nr:LOB domain-containing protein 29-like [Andrographis paniculata]
MTGSGSPCGACKFLRRKCIRGCVFAPYFCHEQGASHFAAIHKVFGASNVSKLLAHLPVTDRCEAAVTISYEAQARLQDPIYGCVSHIFALQQQVVNLQAQLACLREQAIMNNGNVNLGAMQNPNPNPDPKIFCSNSNFPQDFQNWFQNFQNQGSMMPPQSSNGNNDYYNERFENLPYFGSSSESMENTSIDSQSNDREWNTTTSFQDDADDLQSVAFRYIHH